MATQSLRERLDKDYPNWYLEFDNDPRQAAIELGLVDAVDVAAADTMLDFNDESDNWARLEELYDAE